MTAVEYEWKVRGNIIMMRNGQKSNPERGIEKEQKKGRKAERKKKKDKGIGWRMKLIKRDTRLNMLTMRETKLLKIYERNLQTI